MDPNLNDELREHLPKLNLWFYSIITWEKSKRNFLL